MNEMVSIQTSVFVGENELLLDYMNFEGCFSLGLRVYDQPKHFHYEWLVEYMERGELSTLRDAIDTILKATETTEVASEQG